MEAPGHSAPREESQRGGEKSPDAFRTISEVSAALDVPQHVLRFWEGKFAQIRPLKRGGGRRYYRPDDVDLLRGIQALLYSDGYTIKGVQKLLRENGVKYVIAAGRKRNEPKARNSAAAPRTSGPIAEVADAAPSPEAAPEFADRPILGPDSGQADQEGEAASCEPGIAPEAAGSDHEAEADAADENSSQVHAAEPAGDGVSIARREAAARLLSQLKALRREYDLKLRAAKHGRTR